jgi:hypothetical protein
VTYKPSEFFLGIIDFFGILIPGAVLVYLHRPLLLGLLDLIGAPPPVPDNQVSLWIIFLIGAYVLGQFLFGIGELLDKLQKILQPESKDVYYQGVKGKMDLPVGKKNRKEAYYRAYSIVRLSNTDAIAEIDRQTAEFKLFRSLAVVFLLDFPLAWASGVLDWGRAAVMIVLFALALWRFLYLLHWAQRLTFEFYTLLPQAQAPTSENR